MIQCISNSMAYGSWRGTKKLLFYNTEGKAY